MSFKWNSRKINRGGVCRVHTNAPTQNKPTTENRKNKWTTPLYPDTKKAANYVFHKKPHHFKCCFHACTHKLRSILSGRLCK